jgi:hypothetical protein
LHGDLKGLRLPDPTVPVYLHQFVETLPLHLAKPPFSIVRQQVSQFLLQTSIHLHVTQRKNLIVRQRFHRRFGSDAVYPLHQDIFEATMSARSQLFGALQHLIR